MDQVFNASALIRDLTYWLYGLIPATGGLAYIVHYYLGTTSGDDQEVALHKRAQRKAIYGTIAALAINSGIGWLSRYVGR